MTVTKKIEGNTLTAVVEGRINTLTAPDLEAAVREDLENILHVVFDFSGVEYISSSGIRVLIFTSRALAAKSGNMVLRGVRQEVMEIFEVAGLDGAFTFE